MKITQVTPGLIEIPPKGWGAIEKIIWNYDLELSKLGNETNISYLNDIDVSSDIIHIHVANLALEAYERGIPYIFSLHDHHVVQYGKESELYRQNLDAIKKSIISFTHAEFLVDYFDTTDKLFYLSHGVDTKKFIPKDLTRKEHKLLCLANNGFANNQSEDRKGFRFAIEAAKTLDLPITVVGPKNNENFFNSNKDLLDYDKLTVINTNPDEDEIISILQEHSIFIHPSILEAGHPNLTILEALSSGLPVIGTYSGSQKLDGLISTVRDSNEIVNSLNYVIDHYEELVNKTQETKLKYDWSIITKRLFDMYRTVKIISKSYDSTETKNLYINEYKTPEVVSSKISFNYNFINGPYFELVGEDDKTYTVSFVDSNGVEQYREDIKCGTWVRLNKKYYNKWTINLFESDKLVFTYTLNYTNKRVYIAFDSSSLGDTIAWVPYVEEFRKKHNCHVICSTFKNDLVRGSYPNIEFVEPGSVVNEIHGMYNIGWFYDMDKELTLPNVIPLQQSITNILGLEFNEINPKIKFPIKPNQFKDKYVTIATTSTAQLKYWNFTNGWQLLCDELKNMGYRVVHVSNEKSDIKGITELKDKSLLGTMNAIHHSEFFIGLSSGLSWLSWSIGKKVVMISNFTEPDHEFTTNCYRVTKNDVCNGCWNNPLFKFDKGDWNWCPEHKDTPRHFECHKSITPEMVLEQIKVLLNEN